MLSDHKIPKQDQILLTGATGYVGGRLLARLEQRGEAVRCLVRRPTEMVSRVGSMTEVVAGDLQDASSVLQAMQGIDTAYYLVHSMGSREDFAEEDRQAAENFANAASHAGVKRIIYLGALGMPDPGLSKHLRSRQEVGDILRNSNSQVIEFRASIIIGSGSLSFELIRSLVECLPVMICPRWVRTMAQPIAIEDVLEYLMCALKIEQHASQIYEIGGPHSISYAGIMQEYARQRKLPRLMIPVPVLTPGLSSRWLGLVTPLYARIGKKLIQGLRNPTLVSNNLAETTFSVEPMDVHTAIARALQNEDQQIAETRWSDSLSSGGQARDWGGVRFGSRLVDSRTLEIPIPPEIAFTPIQRIGGKVGWYYGTWLWSIRGLLDLLVGGVGLRRGRRDPESVRVGDTLDFWRVEKFVPNQILRLRAEMKLPGRAWLEFEVTGNASQSKIRQTASFDPVGLFGRTYWYSVWPLHQFVFGGMLRNLGREAERIAATSADARREMAILSDQKTVRISD